MSDELVEVYAAADVDRAVNIVVLTGAGEHFCVGADLALETSRDGPLLGKAVNDSFVPLVTARDLAGRVVLAVLACRKPSIAAINGTAVGVGITMTLAMDIRVCVEDAKIGASTTLLWRLVGQTRALDWTLTGRVFAAHEARDAGLFTTLVARRADVLPRALAYADMIASQCAPQMTVLARALMWHGLHADVSGTHLLESKCVQHAWNNQDLVEGVTSFLEKRDPKWTTTMNDRMPSFYPWWTSKNVDIPGGGIGIRAKL